MKKSTAQQPKQPKPSVKGKERAKVPDNEHTDISTKMPAKKKKKLWKNKKADKKESNEGPSKPKVNLNAPSQEYSDNSPDISFAEEQKILSLMGTILKFLLSFIISHISAS